MVAMKTAVYFFENHKLVAIKDDVSKMTADELVRFFEAQEMLMLGQEWEYKNYECGEKLREEYQSSRHERIKP